MARPKKDGKRATGIQGKKGYLYIVISQPIIKDGIKKYEKKWLSTGLADTPENVKKASTLRTKMLDNNIISTIDRNITLSDYIDCVLERKKCEVSDTTYSGYFYRGKRISESFCEIKLRDINKNMVEKFLDSLFEVHNLQPRTVKDIKVFFGNVMEQAFNEGLIAYNPIKEIVINKTLSSKIRKRQENRQ